MLYQHRLLLHYSISHNKLSQKNFTIFRKYINSINIKDIFKIINLKLIKLIILNLKFGIKSTKSSWMVNMLSLIPLYKHKHVSTKHILRIKMKTNRNSKFKLIFLFSLIIAIGKKPTNKYLINFFHTLFIFLYILYLLQITFDVFLYFMYFFYHRKYYGI